MAGAVKECSPASLQGGWNFIQKEVADFKLVDKMEKFGYQKIEERL